MDEGCTVGWVDKVGGQTDRWIDGWMDDGWLGG